MKRVLKWHQPLGVDSISSIGSRQALARLGAIFCAGLTIIVGARWLFHDALPGQNHWASLDSEPDLRGANVPL